MALCRICGDEFPDARLTEAGLDYCMNTTCRTEAARPVSLIAVAVNKAAPVFMTRTQALAEGLIRQDAPGDRVKLGAATMPTPRRTNGYPA